LRPIFGVLRPIFGVLGPILIEKGRNFERVRGQGDRSLDPVPDAPAGDRGGMGGGLGTVERKITYENEGFYSKNRNFFLKILK
jgi:hypothetical protein